VYNINKVIKIMKLCMRIRGWVGRKQQIEIDFGLVENVKFIKLDKNFVTCIESNYSESQLEIDNRRIIPIDLEIYLNSLKEFPLDETNSYNCNYISPLPDFKDFGIVAAYFFDKVSKERNFGRNVMNYFSIGK